MKQKDKPETSEVKENTQKKVGGEGVGVECN